MYFRRIAGPSNTHPELIQQVTIRRVTSRVISDVLARWVRTQHLVVDDFELKIVFFIISLLFKKEKRIAERIGQLTIQPLIEVTLHNYENRLCHGVICLAVYGVCLLIILSNATDRVRVL